MRPAFLPLAITLALLGASATPFASAQGFASDQTPAGQWVEAEFTMTFASLTDISLTGSLKVREFTDGGDLYTAKDIRDSFAGSNRFGKKVGDAFVTDLEATLKTQVQDVLADAFPRATTREVTTTTIDRASLSASGGAYDPPVLVAIGATIVRPLSTLGLESYSAEAIDTVFAAGAAVTTDFTLSTQAGYVSTFTLVAPAGRGFSDPSEGTVTADASTLTIVRDNLQGTSSLATPASVKLLDPSATPPTAEDIATDVQLALGALGEPTLEVTTTIDVAIHAVDAAARFGDSFPSTVELSYLSADAVRELHRTGALSDEDLASASDAIKDLVSEKLTAAFGESASLDGAFVASSLTGAASAPFDTDPPLKYAATSTNTKAIDDEKAEHADVALRIGAALALDVQLFASETRESAFVITAPEGTVFAEGTTGDVAADGRSVRVVVPPATETAPEMQMKLRDPSAPVFVTEASQDGVLVGPNGDSSLSITLDIKDLDISIGKAIGGDLGNVLIDLAVQGNLGIVKIPDDVKPQLGSTVELDYLASDAIRLLLDEGVIEEQTILDLETDLLDRISEQLSGSLGGSFRVTGGFDRATLDPTLISTPISGDEPIVFRASLSIAKPLSGGETVQRDAAIALYTAPAQTFDLPRVEGQDTSYKIILPAGLSVADLQVTGGSYETATEPDGRESFTVTPTDETAQASVSMAVTPSFVIAKFWPVLLLAVLVIFLLVGTPIAFVIMRRRKHHEAPEEPRGEE